MLLNPAIKSSLPLLNNTNIITDEIYKKLLDISIQDLLHSKRSDVKPLCAAKPDIIMEAHAAMMQTFLAFAQHNINQDKAQLLLTKDCKIDGNRSKLLLGKYDKHKLQLQYKLGNIGTHLPHIVDVQWEIDFLIKSSVLDESQGPLFKITLITEHYDKVAEGCKMGNVVFWCTAQEMQDLVYKLEDAVRHCQKIASGL